MTLTSDTFRERPDSRSSTKDPPSFTYRYTASGEQDDSIVSAFALNVTPPAVATPIGLLYRQDIRIDPVGWRNYTVTVPYGPRKKESGSWTFRYDTTGATAKVKCAKEHISSWIALGEIGPMGNKNPHEGAIGVKPDGDVEGTEIVIPCLKLSVDVRHPQGLVTIGRAKHLANCTGRFNSETYLEFAPGELLFLGSTGGDGTQTEAEASYHFAGSANATDLKFGEIQNIVKLGWHYAWVEFERGVDADDGPATKPKVVHIERVYDGLNFASAFGWS
ncbi:MAG: hypothetical protein K8T91_21395 [Planctomycetes bacterium]|nr:hypothetical protein [Planctomycetota bacterium]